MRLPLPCRLPLRRIVKKLRFVTSQTTGIISPLLADPSNGEVRWSEFAPSVIDLCDSTEEQSKGFPACDVSPTTPNHAAPIGIYWSQATGKIYSYLSGYQSVVEIDPDAFPLVPGRRVETGAFQSAAMTPNGRYLILFGVDLSSDPTKVMGKLGFIDLTKSTLTLAGGIGRSCLAFTVSVHAGWNKALSNSIEFHDRSDGATGRHREER